MKCCPSVFKRGNFLKFCHPFAILGDNAALGLCRLCQKLALCSCKVEGASKYGTQSEATEWLALASDQVPHNLQALRAHASGESGCIPANLMVSVVVADLPGRERLRSSSSFRYELSQLKLKFGERRFLFSGPKAWNSLPFNL